MRKCNEAGDGEELAVRRRFACVSSSRRDVQTKSDRPYSASIDQYGTIIAQNGIARSHAKASDGTPTRCAAVQFARPYVMKKNGARNRSHANARRQGRPGSGVIAGSRSRVRDDSAANGMRM